MVDKSECLYKYPNILHYLLGYPEINELISQNFEKYTNFLQERIYIELLIDILFDDDEGTNQKIKDTGLLEVPASISHHGAYKGGLMEHSLNVTEALLRLTRNEGLKWSTNESPLVIGLLHDLCKTDDYIKCSENEECPYKHGYKRNTKPKYKGHGSKSAQMIQDLGVYLTNEEEACIRYHMGAFTNKEEWIDYTAAIHNYPNVLWTHHADMIAAHIMEVE